MSPSKRRHTYKLTLCGLLFAGAGCYRYSASSVESLRIGESVRARISGAQAERLEPVLGYTDRSIEGDLLEKADSALVIAVATPLSSEASAGVSRAYQRIAIPRNDLQEIEIRRLDRTRTSLAVVGATVGVAAVVVGVSQAIQLGQSGSRPNPTKNRLPARATLIRIRLTR